MKIPTLPALLFALLAACQAAYGYNPQLEAAFDSLDIALQRHSELTDSRLQQIDSLKAAAGNNLSAPTRLQIARAYTHLDVDSAMEYLYDIVSRPAEVDSATLFTADMEFARQSAKIQQYSDAFTYLNRHAGRTLTPDERISFLITRSKILTDCYSNCHLENKRELIRHAAIDNLDSLIKVLPPDGFGLPFSRAKHYLLDGDSVMAEGELLEIIDHITPADTLYSRTHKLLADIYRNRPDKREQYLYSLALAAISDAEAGNHEAYALQQLGAELFTHNDFDRAYTYLSQASELLRRVSVQSQLNNKSAPLNILLRTMHEHDHSRQAAYLAVMILLLIATLIFIYSTVRMRRASHMQHVQAEALENQLAEKDRFVGQLLNLCAHYLDDFDEFNKLAVRKIKTGQVHDLYEMIESGKAARDRTERFARVFDAAALKIFPDLTARVNTLLQPDKQLEQPAPDTLTPELRILVFLRIGVTDSPRISKFLGLSLNTVYTYRNRLKGRARIRETFETDILHI